jgi:single-strand DNA-binding protein
MKSVNRVTLLGNVGRDPEVRVLTGGNAVAEFSLATSTGGYNTKDGREVPQKTQWHRIKAFGAITSNIEKYVKKGSTIYMEGRIEYSEYEKNGEKRQSTEIILEDMSLLSKPQAAPQPTQQPNPFPQHQPMGTPQQSDDLPF